MAIGDKTQKILWARAAGRCSMSECRVALTLDPESQSAATLGEMCHIVGQGDGSARSDSPLSSDDRDRYANLILLCRHHHRIIDEDEERYPIELLHQIKVEHEQWVAERLGGVEEDPARVVISSWIDTVTFALRLERWDWLVEHAVRDLMHESLLGARGLLNKKELATVWPQVEPELEESVRSLVEAVDHYVGHFESNAELRGDFLARDRSYARFVNPDYAAAAEAEDRWSRRNFTLLMELVIALNRYADLVRERWNPLYFIEHGRFLIIDSMGYRFPDGGYLLPDQDAIVRYRDAHDPPETKG